MLSLSNPNKKKGTRLFGFVPDFFVTPKKCIYFSIVLIEKIRV